MRVSSGVQIDRLRTCEAPEALSIHMCISSLQIIIGLTCRGPRTKPRLNMSRAFCDMSVFAMGPNRQLLDSLMFDSSDYIDSLRIREAPQRLVPYTCDLAVR